MIKIKLNKNNNVDVGAGFRVVVGSVYKVVPKTKEI